MRFFCSYHTTNPNGRIILVSSRRTKSEHRTNTDNDSFGAKPNCVTYRWLDGLTTAFECSVSSTISTVWGFPTTRTSALPSLSRLTTFPTTRTSALPSLSRSTTFPTTSAPPTPGGNGGALWQGRQPLLVILYHEALEGLIMLCRLDNCPESRYWHRSGAWRRYTYCRCLVSLSASHLGVFKN